MAISKNNLSGQFTGKLGNTVFYNLNGQLVCRTIGKQGKSSKKQLANQQAMAIAMEVLKPMQVFIKSGFELQAKGTVRNAFNLAISHTKKHALKGEYPNISVDYSKVLLSSGTLPAANEISMTKVAEGVTLDWDPNGPTPHAWQDDLVMVVLYFPSLNFSRIHLNAAKRSDGSHFIPLEKQLLSIPIETYLCFKSADGERISDSVYVGNLNGTVETAQETQQKAKYNEVKAHFDKVEINYLKQKDIYFESGINGKSFRNVETEYRMLKIKLRDLPGKTGD